MLGCRPGLGGGTRHGRGKLVAVARRRTATAWRSTSRRAKSGRAELRAEVADRGRARPFFARRRRRPSLHLHPARRKRSRPRRCTRPMARSSGSKSYPAPYEVNPPAAGHGKGPKSTPVVADGRLFTLGISGILSCWDAETRRPEMAEGILQAIQTHLARSTAPPCRPWSIMGG